MRSSPSRLRSRAFSSCVIAALATVSCTSSEMHPTAMSSAGAQRAGFDGLRSVALDYGVSGVPESFLVDPSGIVRAKITGGVTSLGLDRILEQLQGSR